MRLKSALFALPLSLILLAPHASFADTLKLTSTAGGSKDGAAVYPYVFTVTEGSTTTTGVDLSCLSFNREVQTGESWSVNATNLDGLSSSVNGSSVFQLDEDAYLDSLYNTSAGSNSEIQFAIWSILDPSQVNNHSSYDNSGAFDATAQALVTAASVFATNDPDTSSNATIQDFYSQFTLFTPVVPSGRSPSDWDGNGEPQQFLEYTPTALTPTPEPSSLLLFGTGLLGTVGIMRRRFLKTQPAA